MKSINTTPSNEPKIICLTPVKNEAWILRLFLKSVSLWADHIIIADQMSDDGSREIANSFSKVTLVDNPASKSFNEYLMRKSLFEEARKISGKKILIALDADEFFPSDIRSLAEFEEIKRLKPGTVITFGLRNIDPTLKKYWSPGDMFPRAFVDDGTKYRADKIHTLNIPYPVGAEVFKCKKITITHFQFADWERMKSKHRWYQCWEHINDPAKSYVSIYRQYHHMYSVKKNDLKNIPSGWFRGYKEARIDLKAFTREEHFRWDKEVLCYIQKYGSSFFANIEIWDKDWASMAKEKNIKNIANVVPNRPLRDKIIFLYLKNTQKFYPNIFLLMVDKILKLFIKQQ